MSVVTRLDGFLSVYDLTITHDYPVKYLVAGNSLSPDVPFTLRGDVSVHVKRYFLRNTGRL